MKITEKILSIPPYISTSWSQIAALRMKGNLLYITLHDGETISIPNLDQSQIDSIFNFHVSFLEKETLSIPHSTNQVVKEDLKLEKSPTALSFAFGAMDGFSSVIQHNPDQAHSPDLPLEVLSKISEVARSIYFFDDVQMPKAEPHCNCFHCQIARAIQTTDELYAFESEPKTEKTLEEEVRDDELQFEQWDITQTGEKLYSVVNRLDNYEQYNVFLGNPVGCTCGKVNCEHILVVLKS